MQATEIRKDTAEKNFVVSGQSALLNDQISNLKVRIRIEYWINVTI